MCHYYYIDNIRLLSKAFVESYRFEKKRVAYDKKVTYFIGLVEAQKSEVRIQSREIIDYKWANFQEAISLITYKEAKNVLRSAFNFLNR